MTKARIQQTVFITAGLLTVAGAIAQIAGIPYSAYMFAVGSILLVYSHFTDIQATNAGNFRIRRLSRIGFISSLMLLAAGYFMFTGSNVWVVCLLIYALTTLVLSFRKS